MPSCFALSLVLGVVGVAAQQAYDTPSPTPNYSTPLQLSAYGTPTEVPSTGTTYEYHGCAIVDLNGFDEPLYVESENLTPETCQGVCEGKRIVAIFSDSCRCGDDPNAFKETDDMFCDNPCLGDPTRGMCGSACDDTGDKISTIYIAVEEAPEDPVDPTVSPLVEPPPATPDSPPDPNAAPSDPQEEAEDVDPASLPPPQSGEPEVPLEQPEDVPETPEDAPEDPPAPEQPEDPSSSSIDTEPTEPDTEPDTESLEPDPVPEDPTETVPEDGQDTLEPTPSRVIVAGACLNQFPVWSMLGGLLLSLLVAG